MGRDDKSMDSQKMNKLDLNNNNTHSSSDTINKKNQRANRERKIFFYSETDLREVPGHDAKIISLMVERYYCILDQDFT